MANLQQPVEQLFAAALDVAPENRRAFLDRACRNAPYLRAAVEQLLREDEQAGSFLRNPLVDFARSNADDTCGGSDDSDVTRKPVAPRFAAGQRIADRFVVVRFVARGGMGEVYEVEDSFLQGLHIALKVIRPEIAADAEAAHRFEQEVLLARRINHPNLCPIYDIFRCQEPLPAFLFLTMKLLEGETLSARLRRHGLMPREVMLEIFHQMIRGIGALHAAGVIHRDIKPSNVVLSRSGPDHPSPDHSGPDHSGPDHPDSGLCVSIMDFGLARLRDAESTVLKPGMVAGTRGYLAPELLRGHRPSQATDLFALGVLLHQVLTGEHPVEDVNGSSVSPASSLTVADVPPLYAHTVGEFLADEPQRRCRAFEQIWSAIKSHSDLASFSANARSASPRLWTRRHFAFASAATACAVAGGVAWKRDSIYELLHPLPPKRFVAILGWPPLADIRVKPMLLGLIDAMANELARAEAFDHNFYVTAQKTSAEMTSAEQLNDARESLGANLILATSVVPAGKNLHVGLQVLPSPSARPLRSTQVRSPMDQQTSLPEKVVRAAAELLDINRYQPDSKRIKAGTDNPEALAAFQAAEALMKQDNDTGLEAAIEKYKQTLEIDPRYAVAQGKLGWAYIRSYGLHADSAAINLARENCESAILLDPTSVEAHLGLAWIDHETGNLQSSSREMAKALSLDPSNPHTLIYQARFYAENGHWSDAEDTFARVLKLRPNYWLAHNELGDVLSSEGKYPQALMEFRSASLAAPRNALAYANIGLIYIQQGKLSDAVTSLRRSYQLEANDLAAIGLAEVNRITGNYSEAVSFAEDAVKLNSSIASDWLELGDCYSVRAGRGKEAAAAYKRGVEVQAEQLRIEAKNGWGWMLFALLRAKNGEPALAPSLVARAETFGADDLDSQMFKVRILAILERWQEAFIVMARCLTRGATVFQFQNMPDLKNLRSDPRYRDVVTTNGIAANSQLGSQ